MTITLGTCRACCKRRRHSRPGSHVGDDKADTRIEFVRMPESTRVEATFPRLFVKTWTHQTPNPPAAMGPVP
jgi:hypothetical protein